MKLTMSPPHRYRLADHVRACAHGSQVILLDLWRDKYLAVPGSRSAALSQAVADWPVGERGTQLQPDGDKLDSWLCQLMAEQMLVAVGAPRTPRAELEEAVESLGAESLASSRQHGLRRAFRMARSAVTAAAWIRHLSLADIEVRVRRLRQAVVDDASPAHMAQLHDAVVSYCRLRPFLFTVNDRCLLDSLTLINFLAMEGLSASWVIGVRTRPFAAHSWVQRGPLVLNDVHDHVRTYKSILVV